MTTPITRHAHHTATRNVQVQAHTFHQAVSLAYQSKNLNNPSMGEHFPSAVMKGLLKLIPTGADVQALQEFYRDHFGTDTVTIYHRLKVNGIDTYAAVTSAIGSDYLNVVRANGHKILSERRAPTALG